MKKVLCIVDKTKFPVSEDDNFCVVTADMDNALSLVQKERPDLILFYQVWGNGKALQVIEEIRHIFFNVIVACHQAEGVRRMMWAMNCTHTCNQGELKELLNFLTI